MIATKMVLAAVCGALWAAGALAATVDTPGTTGSSEKPGATPGKADQAGPIVLHARRRVAGKDGTFTVRTPRLDWPADRTAAIVCDMWNEHWCKGATARVAEMAPRMNKLLCALRARGVLIIHAPSETMKYYVGQPARRRAQQAPRAKDLPKGIAGWAGKLPSEAGAVWPIDQSDGGCDCQPKCRTRRAWTHQIDTIEIRDEDAISDSGVEIWNLLAERGIENVMLMGVHTNMCVIGRPFGLRNMVRSGKRVVLVRDMTDTMYNSRARPRVNHFRGTDLVVEYIEKYVCPTVVSSDVLGGKPFRFRDDPKAKKAKAVPEPGEAPKAAEGK